MDTSHFIAYGIFFLIVGIEFYLQHKKKTEFVQRHGYFQ